MILQDKNAIVYGAGGSLGGEVALALAVAGANVFLTGRNISSVQKTANKILAAGGGAEVYEVDAFDEKAINSGKGCTKSGYSRYIVQCSRS